MVTILSADVGGTKTQLQLSHLSDGMIKTLRTEIFSSQEHSSFTDVLQAFLTNKVTIDSACFAVAGPVKHSENYSEANITNLPWIINSSNLESQLEIKTVSLINDFEAIGYAIEHLLPEDFVTLQEGQNSLNAVKAVIGAGTGLGQAIMVYNGQRYDVLCTEGGHVDFAANSEIEMALLKQLKTQYSHVSYERVLSGQGLINIFEFLVDKNRTRNDINIQKILRAQDIAAEISMTAEEQSNSVACQAMSLFMKIYGAQAGNLALACLAHGGVYVAGGIAAKNLSAVNDNGFINAFNDKGRMQTLTQNIPVKIIKNQACGLIGATHYACGKLL